VGEIADGILAADDCAVRAALGQELTRLRAAEPAAALGIASGASTEEQRARFLALVKLYHPNRFARRPSDICKLANEVFLLIRRAYQKVGERPAAERLAATQAPPPPGNGTASAAAAVVAARASEISPPSQPKLDVDQALAARRRRARSQPSSSPGGGGGSPATVDLLQGARRREEEQRARFQAALADLGRGELPNALSALRKLAAETPSDRRYRAFLHYVTGRIHESAGRAPEAVAEYDRALAFDPDLQPARSSREQLTGSPSAGAGAGRIGRWFRK